MDSGRAQLFNDSLKSESQNEFQNFISNSQKSIWSYLKSKSQFELPWIFRKIRRYIGYHAEILDVGCGIGIFSNELAKKGHQVVGIDLSSRLIEVAKSNDNSLSVTYEIADAYRLPYKSESFDVVLVVNMFEHLSNPQKALSEAVRVLRPGGILCYTYQEKNRISAALLQRLILRKLQQVPQDYFRYSLLVRSSNFENWLEEEGMEKLEAVNVRPQFGIMDLKAFLFGIPLEGRFIKTSFHVFSCLGVARKLREQ